MNILPKKRWHVRTKENIARVRRDEAEAAEKEKQEKIRIENADREARLNVLKQKSKQKLLEFNIQPKDERNDEPVNQEHINLFADLDHATQKTNKEHDKEVKEKNEEYEKKIGYLTYLGQDTNEALGKQNWYNVPPDSSRCSRSSLIKDTYDKLILKDKDGKPKEKIVDEKDGEIAWKAKQRLDPIHSFIKVSCVKSNRTTSKIKDHVKNAQDKKLNKDNKPKYKNKNQNDLKEKIQKLREARLKREQQEKYKTQMFLSKLSGIVPENEELDKIPKVKPKYNSQFNPEIARQNYR